MVSTFKISLRLTWVNSSGATISSTLAIKHGVRSPLVGGTKTQMAALYNARAARVPGAKLTFIVEAETRNI